MAIKDVNSYFARAIAGDDSHSIPVNVIPGNARPHYTGRSYYWTTPSGKTEVHHPNAYRWPTWYHGSTLTIEVGADYLAAMNPRPARARDGSRMVLYGTTNIIHGATEVTRYITYRHEGWYVRAGKRDYHCKADTPRTALLSACYAWRKQDAAKIAAKRHADEIESRLTSTYVSIEDSIRAGNCAPLTETFAADIWRAIGAAGPCAVRADIVLEKRNDTYTHRAISAAMARP